MMEFLSIFLRTGLLIFLIVFCAFGIVVLINIMIDNYAKKKGVDILSFWEFLELKNKDRNEKKKKKKKKRRISKMNDLNILRDAAYENACDHGWHKDDRKLADFIDRKLSLIALIHSELGEATEAIRKDHWCKEVDLLHLNEQDFKAKVKDTVQDELADTIIRILDFCGLYGIDIAGHVEAKMEYNKGRGYRHGGKLV